MDFKSLQQMFSPNCCEARQKTENNMTHQIDKQLIFIYMQARKIKGTRL